MRLLDVFRIRCIVFPAVVNDVIPHVGGIQPAPFGIRGRKGVIHRHALLIAARAVLRIRNHRHRLHIAVRIGFDRHIGYSRIAQRESGVRAAHYVQILIPASVRPDIRRRALIIFQAVVAVLHILRKSQLAAIGRQLGVQVNAVTCGCSQHEHQQVQRHAIPTHLPLADDDAAPVLQIPRQLLFFARAVTLVIAVPFEERQRIAAAVAEHAPQTGICGADGQLFSVLIADGQPEDPLAGRCAPVMQQHRLEHERQQPADIPTRERPRQIRHKMIRIDAEHPLRQHRPQQPIQSGIHIAGKEAPPRTAGRRNAVFLARVVCGQHDGLVPVYIQPVPLRSVLADGAAHRIRLFALADVPLQYVELACRRLGQRFLAALDGADVGHAQPQPAQQHDLPQCLYIVLGVVAVAVLAACRREQPLLFVKPDVRPG